MRHSQASSLQENEALKPFDINSLVGQKLEDRYQIMDIVGQGGMAVVYRGRRLADGAAVAIKTLKFAEAALMKRFMREVQIHSQLKHPNIVNPIEFFTTADGQTFFVMELLRGRSVEDLFFTRGRFNRPSELKEIVAPVCDALAFAHKLGIVHRDVKPANIIVSIQDGGKVVDVVDFGLAKLHEDLQRITKTGQVLGSPVYMSPEQCRGDSLDPRSDVYSLAVVMYEMVTAELPFDASNPVAMMESHCNPKMIPVSIYKRDPDFPYGRELNSIVRKSMETDPALRYQTIDEFKEAFMAWYQLVEGGPDAALVVAQVDGAAAVGHLDGVDVDPVLSGCDPVAPVVDVRPYPALVVAEVQAGAPGANLLTVEKDAVLASGDPAGPAGGYRDPAAIFAHIDRAAALGELLTVDKNLVFTGRDPVAIFAKGQTDAAGIIAQIKAIASNGHFANGNLHARPA